MNFQHEAGDALDGEEKNNSDNGNYDISSESSEECFWCDGTGRIRSNIMPSYLGYEECDDCCGTGNK